MFFIAFYVPEDHAEKVKEAMFLAGAGTIGNYRRCSFEYKGVGQFEPLAGSDPFIGKVGDVERVPELKVEMVCAEGHLAAAISALKMSHPYETPAYHVIKTVGI
ncbi:NGG1p interacting factor NIF3 [Peredibacter starrii]|uniref:NGG1p interacting factor NIF3 n=1 Tax=Peredibacter starrii TaxID=28202 RepID=A0AAX4HSM1_9BACT|nr:NGG1p interacting factor NIF3 [Peredibacter starrii]WPU66334.1 NGG1p interacting factor NIF3 [Peredibacter starrii]